MYCPQCSQQQTSDQLRFCSRCGFPLEGVAKLVAAGGALPPALREADKALSSPRRKGVQQATILVFISILLLPFVDIIATPYHEVLIFFFLIGGILRALYAFAFQEGPVRNRQIKQNAAPNQIETNWRGEYALSSSSAATADLGEQETEAAGKTINLPDSVTENTTKLLDEQNNSNFR